jgi:hypothetical protein
MKKYFFIIAIVGYIFSTSCDHVENPFPPAIDLDTTIYPGNWFDYAANEFPNAADFDALPIETRNALIEDYTGHNCSFCPAAGEVAHTLHEANPNKVFVASIHASNTPNGMSSFQAVNLAQGYNVEFYNAEGLELGAYFGNTLINSGFFGNPAGTVNRTNDAGEYFTAAGSWSTRVANVLASPLKVNVKAILNYYETPVHGFFLHTEIEKIDAGITNDLALVAYIIEDSLVAPQNDESVFTPDYVHRDIFRGTIVGQTWGEVLTPSMMSNGKYYRDYSYIIPDQLYPQGGTPTGHNAENMHVLIYVYDKVTLEIYQVIKKKLVP